MKYIIVFSLALMSFALQAEDQSLSMSVSVAPETTLTPSVEASINPIRNVNNTENVTSETSKAIDSISHSETAVSIPSFIWILGSLIAGLLAITSSRVVQSQKE